MNVNDVVLNLKFKQIFGDKSMEKLNDKDKALYLNLSLIQNNRNLIDNLMKKEIKESFRIDLGQNKIEEEPVPFENNIILK